MIEKGDVEVPTPSSKITGSMHSGAVTSRNDLDGHRIRGEIDRQIQDIGKVHDMARSVVEGADTHGRRGGSHTIQGCHEVLEEKRLWGHGKPINLTSIQARSKV